jgi:predicted RNA-binding protein YlxR (DUF448 family)
MSGSSHIAIRMCIGCGKRRKKDEMMRFVRKASVQISNNSKPLEGRGFYLCPDLACLRMAQKKARRIAFLESADLDVLRSQIPSKKEA